MFPSFLHSAATIAVLLLAATLSAQSTLAPVDPATEPVQLEGYTVTGEEDDTFDDTGMGTFESEFNDAPFSNSLVMLNEIDDGDSLLPDAADELNAINDPSPAERIAGDPRFKLHGVALPELRDGFIRLGIPESLNAGRTLIIQGALIPVLGRAAPGGIRSTETARPRGRLQRRAQFSFGTLDDQHYRLESTGPVIPKKLWHRIAVNLDRDAGPADFAHSQQRSADLDFTLKHSRRASTRLSLNYLEITGNPSPGLPDYRATATSPILGPYLPLADFNVNGPAGLLQRRSTSATLQFDGAPNPSLSVRANLEAWRRTLLRDYYPRPVLELDTGRFAGVRRPRHLASTDQAYAAQAYATLRFRRFGLDQKALFAASRTSARLDREDRTLSDATLATLPLAARTFDPLAPDYYRPPFDLVAFDRLTTDRLIDATYTALEASDRLALANGRYVFSVGVRYDHVAQRIADQLPAAATPRLAGHTAQLSHHLAANWMVRPNRLLAFAAVSTAFDPATPVDARTGRIQANETTLGYETGLKTSLAQGKLTFSASALLLRNRHIARRNPLYNDPVADADQTQPELVASSEEHFTGGQFELRWQATPTFRLRVRGTYLHAITAVSPDLPAEVGRPLARLPATTASLELRFQPPRQQTGPSYQLGAQYIGSYVANYADIRRAYLAYPGYTLLAASAGYQWRLSQRTLGVSASLRNALDRDLLAAQARPGAGRELVLSTNLAF